MSTAPARIGNLGLTLAHAALAAAESKWRWHKRECPLCVAASRRRHWDDACATGATLLADRAACRDDVKAEQKLAKQPAPGQGTLFGLDEIAREPS